jgi:hypothetical protein
MSDAQAVVFAMFNFFLCPLGEWIELSEEGPNVVFAPEH